VPPQSRWAPPGDEAHRDVGDFLNKALGPGGQQQRSLDGVLEHIDFTRKVGQSKIPDRSCAS
jgi:type I restriction enzyme M protein